MTSNQIAYAAHREGVRHNIATEQETKRSNIARETETTRHNVATEQESFRHNVVTERETSRHNVAQEQLGWSQLEETNRHNLAQEAIGFESNEIDRIKTNIARQELAAKQPLYRAQTQQQLSSSRNQVAQSEKTKEQIKYLDDTNMQGWISTVGNTASNLWKAVTSTWKLIGD